MKEKEMDYYYQVSKIIKKINYDRIAHKNLYINNISDNSKTKSIEQSYSHINRLQSDDIIKLNSIKN